MSATTLRRLMVGALALGFLVLMLVSATTAWLVARNQDFTSWVDHTYTVERRLSLFSDNFETAEAARRGYFLTRDPQYLTIYRMHASQLPTGVEQLQTLTSDNPRQQRFLAELDSVLTRKLDGLEASIAAAQSHLAQGTAALVEQDQAAVARIRDLLSAMVDEENRLLAVRTERQTANGEELLAVVLASGLLLTALGVAAFFLVRRYAADLGASESELKALNEGLEQAVRERTVDPMRANDEIQRFAYIVSHDLRSPLVNVMGFTSELDLSLRHLQALMDRLREAAPALVSTEAEQAVTTDIPESIGFIRSSTQKMDRLINAILKLSREGRRTLNPERLDMNAVMAGIVASLKHQADERGATIQVDEGLPEIVSDRLAVEQVFSNLVENALKYLKPGRPGLVQVRGRKLGPMLIFEIEDNGRGIDPKDGERIFELFRRSGVQDQPGEGIGLAHVRALTYRLGGAISVESALDQGATFRVSLPPTFQLDEGARP